MLAALLILGVLIWAQAVHAADKRPNIVLVLVDDMRLDDVAQLPRLRSMMTERGISFEQYFAPNALCCPSRVSTLRGQFSHNTGIWTNFKNDEGGFYAAYTRGLETETIAVWLQRAGYETAMVGKYLNEYGKTFGRFDSARYTPPGWDDWYALLQGATGKIYGGYDYGLNDNGVIRNFGSAEADYSTDVLSRQATSFIDRVTGYRKRKPFFLYLAPVAPHAPMLPAPRHLANSFATYDPDLGPAFNEADVSDKPDWLRALPQFTSRTAKHFRDEARRRLGTLLAVEDMMVALFEALERGGAAENTFVFFASDNGYHLGEHRLRSKATVYEEAVRVPLIVRGPGVAASVGLPHMVYNHDLTSTFAAIAGANPPDFLDGKSILPLLVNPERPPAEIWRTAVLLEHRDRSGGAAAQPDVFAIRTPTFKYSEYVDAAQRCELYRIGSGADPFELDNRCDDPSLAAVRRDLATRLGLLQGCAAAACRDLEAMPFSTQPAVRLRR